MVPQFDLPVAKFTILAVEAARLVELVRVCQQAFELSHSLSHIQFRMLRQNESLAFAKPGLCTTEQCGRFWYLQYN